MKLIIGACALAALAGAASASADCPQPSKPVPAALYSGRWYEIARTNNKLQAGCEGDTSDFSNYTAGVFQVVKTCHQGSLTGPAKTVNVKGHVLPSSDNTKLTLGFLGGLVSQEYWIVDHSDDNQWAIMATPNGRYVWLISREPVLPAAVRTGAMGRIQAMGFDMSRVIYPEQPSNR